MAQDYHIYIHSDSIGTSGSKTQPFSVKSSDGTSGAAGFATKVSKAYSKGSAIASGSAASSGVSALAKASPWIAAIIIAIKITDKVLTTGFSHQEEYQGKYENNVNYNNFKTALGNVFNPIGFAKTIIHSRAQFNKQNKEIAQQNRLIGNSILKEMNIGV